MAAAEEPPFSLERVFASDRNLVRELSDTIYAFSEDCERQWKGWGGGLVVNIKAGGPASEPIPFPLDKMSDLLDHIADLTLGSIDELIGDMVWVEEIIELPAFRERLEVRLAKQMVGRFQDSTPRALHLLDLIVEARPSAAVRRYLRRLSRCYISGFDPEAVILCRAALENALREAFTCRNRSRPDAFSAACTEAVKARWLSSSSRELAMTIWVRGNKSVHDDPNVVHDALGTIRMLMTVLQELCPATDDGRSA